MELINKNEIKSIIAHFGPDIKPIKWYFEEFQDKLIGYLGDHLKLIMEVEKLGVKETLRFFVKCMPRNDQWKSEYLKELKFFKKEYVMLSSLFKQFDDKGIKKWRPKLLHIREDLFVFEDVGHLGYLMPNHCETMTYSDLKATIQTLARFHAASYVLEEKKSEEIGRPYRIWEDYSEYLQEPTKGLDWRDTGRNAVIDFLKVFSKYKNEANIMKKAESVIPMLFDNAMCLMKPSTEYRNVVVHRDLWTNNIMLKKSTQSDTHVIIVDFQTVIYTSPMLDLTSLVYFNTTRSERDEFVTDFINIYYECLSSTLKCSNISLEEIFPKEDMIKSYDESIVFGITQAALIVPITSMSSENRVRIFCDKEKSVKANIVSRSEDFIAIAEEDTAYCDRVCELFDEIVHRYVIQ